MLTDVWGNSVRLTEERRAHLTEHPELHGQEDKLTETLLEPDIVTQSQSDNTVRLFHRFYKGLVVGDKYLCVVVKYLEGDIFIITAYFADKIKTGGILWIK